MKKNFIEITQAGMSFNFPELGPKEKLNVVFNRTLRIPDDNKKYGLPPSIGRFPVEHVEDYAKNLPETWAAHGGVFFPMYQAEAMWMGFNTQSGRPFAIKVSSGKVNAVSGKQWTNELVGQSKDTNDCRVGGQKVEPDYMVSPKQPWLDGFNVGKGVIRQFVAVSLESGYTVEEQVTGKAEVGGIQIIVYPMKEEKWQEILKAREEENRRSLESYGGISGAMGGLESVSLSVASVTASSASFSRKSVLRSAKPDMGLGAGGMMTQEIFEDEYGIDAWDQTQGLRVFVHLANSEQYKEITGKNPPTEAPTPNLYNQYGYPWFQYYDDGAVLNGSEILSKVDSIGSMQTKKNEKILPDDGHKPGVNQPIIALGKKTVKGGKW